MAKRSNKRRSTKRRSPKRSTKKRSTKRSTKRRTTKRSTKRRTTKKRSSTKKRSTRRGGPSVPRNITHSRQGRSLSDSQMNEYHFMVWYKSKPHVNNRLHTTSSSLKLDDDDEWKFTGYVKASSKDQAKSWLRSLGGVKRYSEGGGERLEVG